MRANTTCRVTQRDSEVRKTTTERRTEAAVVSAVPQKQTELLSRAADRYQLPARPADFRLSDYSTMGTVADFVFSGLTARLHNSAPLATTYREKPLLDT